MIHMINEEAYLVLVVDDEKSWRDLVAEIFEARGWRVDSAESLEEGEALISQREYDLAILDIRLVDSSHYSADGFALLRDAKRLQPYMKAVILTGYPDSQQRTRALETYGADYYLEKAPDGSPLDIDQFEMLIVRLLHR